MIELYYNKNNILFKPINDGRTIDNVIIKGNEDIDSEIKRNENYASFMCSLRKKLEEEENLNKWIDLIFGINEKYYYIDENNKKAEYYETNSEVDFKTKKSILEDEVEMEMVNFGLLPYQLFHKEFPKKDKKSSEDLLKLYTLNKELFKDEHIKLNSPIQTFLCKGRLLIDYNYIKIIESNEKLVNKLDYFNVPENLDRKIKTLSQKESINDLIFFKSFGFIDKDEEKIDHISIDNMNLVNYFFIGDIFGTVQVYTFREDNKKDSENNEKEEKEKKEIHNKSEYCSKFSLCNFDFEVILIKELYNHSEEIKYIDFNSRLNLLLSYSLDNYINIYITPKFKLINVIDVLSFINENDYNAFDEVVLLSYPFPSIVCHNKNYIYYLSINGDLIKYDELFEGDKIIFSIDKNMGTVEDKVEIYDSENNLKNIFNYFEMK